MIHSYGDAQVDHELVLRSALLIYHSPGSALVMAHDILTGDSGADPSLAAGYPLTRELTDRLLKGMAGIEPVTRGVRPLHVLDTDGIRTAWYRPATRRPIWFSRKYQPGLQDVTRREVLHPALLFVADPGHLQVWALAADDRPDNDTPIYQAPYLNLYGDGGVCGGTVEWPKSTAIELIGQWEDAFFRSEGTFPTHDRLTLFPGGHGALWRAMRTATEFPADSLVPLGQTVLDALNHTGKPYTGPVRREAIVRETPALEAA